MEGLVRLDELDISTALFPKRNRIVETIKSCHLSRATDMHIPLRGDSRFLTQLEGFHKELVTRS